MGSLVKNKSIRKTDKVQASALKSSSDNIDDFNQSNSQDLLLKEALIASFGDGVIIVNEYGHITDINDKALQMLGSQRSELINTWLPDSVQLQNMQGEKISSSERPVAIALLTGEAVTEVVKYVRNDGQTFPASVTASPLILKDKPTGAIIVFRDFSREILVDKAKDEFVSFASHQLRTPLTAIKMYSEILKSTDSGKLSKEQASYVDRIEVATKKMIDLVSDFLNISKLELGNLELKLVPINISEFVQIHIDELAAVAKKKSVTIDFNPRIREIVAPIDTKLISQVIHNLLTNSLRYTSPNKGIIKVSLKRNKNNYVISVSDNGIGIPDDEKARIFERFFRARNATEHQSDGTGLGLYLARRIAESSGGSLKFESQVGKGTTFLLSLPLKPKTKY